MSVTENLPCHCYSKVEFDGIKFRCHVGQRWSLFASRIFSSPTETAYSLTATSPALVTPAPVLLPSLEFASSLQFAHVQSVMQQVTSGLRLTWLSTVPLRFSRIVHASTFHPLTSLHSRGISSRARSLCFSEKHSNVGLLDCSNIILTAFLAKLTAAIGLSLSILCGP